jgi:uncharacterized protein
MMPAAQLLFGRVYHCRLRPVRHAFAYPVFLVRMPLSAMAGASRGLFSVDRWNLLSLRSADHGPRDGSPLEPWARDLFAREGIRGVDGEIILETFPRVLGYVFNPISIFYGHDRAGSLKAVLCEVSNTFGEHHNYLLQAPGGRAIASREWLEAGKVFHVSPFCEIVGHYRFRFAGDERSRFAQIDYHDEGGKLLITTIDGHAEPLTAGSAAKAFLSFPFLTAGVLARIHWQALKLWLKRVPWFSKPEPPIQETTR